MKGSNVLLFLGLFGGAGFIVHQLLKKKPPTLVNPTTPTYMLLSASNELPDTTKADWFLSEEYRR